MRKISLDRLTPDMKLGKSVCHGTSILIVAGTCNLNQFISNLERLGIYSLYVEDDVCEGIEIDDVVSDRTRMRCKKTLIHTFEKLGSNFTVDRARVTDTVESLMEEIISHPDTLISLNEISCTDDDTLDHSINTTIFSICMGLSLNYSRKQMLELAEGTLLHDVGKTVLDKKIVFKPGRLSTEEFEYIKTHAQLGYDLLTKVYALPETSRQIALCHHERMDGSGYPYAMHGEQISEFCRIAAIVDVYEALIADRCYRKAIRPYHAMEILTEETAEKLDLGLSTLFMQNVAVFPNGTTVGLSDGRMGIVKSQNYSMPLRPIVRVVDLVDGTEAAGVEIDLMKALNLTIVEPTMEHVKESSVNGKIVLNYN